MLKKIILISIILFANFLCAEEEKNKHFSLYKSYVGFRFNKIPENYDLILQGQLHQNVPIDIKAQFFNKDNKNYFNIETESNFNNYKYKELMILDKVYNEKNNSQYLSLCYKEECTLVARELLQNGYAIISLKAQHSTNEYYTISVVADSQLIKNVTFTSTSKENNLHFEHSNLAIPLNVSNFSIKYI